MLRSYCQTIWRQNLTDLMPAGRIWQPRGSVSLLCFASSLRKRQREVIYSPPPHRRSVIERASSLPRNVSQDCCLRHRSQPCRVVLRLTIPSHHGTRRYHPWGRCGKAKADVQAYPCGNRQDKRRRPCLGRKTRRKNAVTQGTCLNSFTHFPHKAWEDSAQTAWSCFSLTSPSQALGLNKRLS